MKASRLMERPSPKDRIPLKITLIYALIGSLWILFSDQILAALVTESTKITGWQTYKGWLYVILTAAVLYALIRRNVAALQRSEAALDNVQRAYKTLSAGNQAVVRSINEAELLRNVCQAIVQTGDYRLAWVGLAEQDEEKTVRPIAHAGYEAGYLDTLTLTWADAEGGRGPTGKAIRSGRPSVSKHIPTDPAFKTNWAEARELGYASSVALPLMDDGRAFGALNVYAAEADAFGEEEIRLLSEMAGDLAYGIIALRTRVEQARTQEALQASEARLRSTLDNMLEGAQIIGYDWRYLYINDAVARHGRQTREQLLGHTMMERYPGIEETEVFAVLRRCMEERTAHTMENEFTYPDGSKGWFELSIQPVPEGVFVLSLDITERKQSEKVLQQYTERLEVLHRIDQGILAAQAPEAIAEATMHDIQKLIPCQRASVTLLDFQAGEFSVLAAQTQGDSSFDKGTRAPLGAFGGDIKTLQTGKPYIVEDTATLNPLPDGIQALRDEGMQAYMNVPLLADDTLLGTLNIGMDRAGVYSPEQVAVAREIADQLAIAIQNTRLYQELEAYSEFLEQGVEQRTKELREIKDRLQTILNSVAEGLMVVASDGHIEQVNPAFEELTGYPGQALESRSFHQVLSEGGMPDEQLEEIQASLAAGEPWRGEISALRRDDTPFDAALTVGPMRLSEDIGGDCVLSLRDITDRKEVERMKDAFVSNVTHELRTPLTVFKLYLDLLEKTLRPEVRDEHIPTLKREVARLDRIIEDVLRLSRLDQGHVAMILTPVDLNALVDQYVADRQPLADQKDLALSFQGQSNLPTIKGDEGLLGQVLNVLLTNALNYTPAQGQVTVTTQTSQSDVQEWIGFSVSDTGPGIMPEEREQLFLRFTRGKAGLESGAAGTGLGLSIAKQIVDRHEGRIEVISEGVPGEGATFSVWLPIDE